MSYCTRIAAITLGFGLVLAPSGLAHAFTVSTPPPGTWNYNFTLGNGASFQMTMNGAFGTPGSNITGFGFTGSPNGYVSDPTIVTSGNNTYHYAESVQVPDGGFDQELIIQFDVASGDYSSTLDYTFVEPTSFWQTTGTPSFNTGDGEFISGYLGWSSSLANNSDGLSPGEVGEGANFAMYGTVPSDPPCTSCFIHITFTPLVVTTTPEPSTFTLLGTGVAAVFGVYRRRRLS